MTKGKNIEKWKARGVSEFIKMSLCHQMARNAIAGIKEYKLKLPLEAVPSIIEMSTVQSGDLENMIIMGKKIETY